MQRATSLEALPLPEGLAELSTLSDATLDPLFWRPERIGISSAWWGHVPFAFWLMKITNPRMLVELGTHTGVSYSAFCEAVMREGLQTRCFSIDTWIGDDQSGFYGEDVYKAFKAFQDQRYGSFSLLLRSSFDEAVEKFDDGSIDLLHIDGLHTYEAVRHDFETWFPKLSDRAVVLFHDSNEREGDFGVWRFWRELTGQFPTFEFLHGHGLGVAAIGREIHPAVTSLCSITEPFTRTRVRERLAFVGERWTAEEHKQWLRAEVGIREDRVQLLEQSLAETTGQAEKLRQEARELEKQLEATAKGRAQSEAARVELFEQQRQAKALTEQAIRTATEAQEAMREEARARLEMKTNLEAANARMREDRDAARGDIARVRLETEAKLAHRIIADLGAQRPAPSQIAEPRISPKDGAAGNGATGRIKAYMDRLAQNTKTLGWLFLLRRDKFRKRRLFVQNVRRIAASPFFDAEWYRKQYPDVSKSGMDPAFHYLAHGGYEGRNPGPNFDSKFYLERYPDIAVAQLNPLLHFLQFGATEGRVIQQVEPVETSDPGARELIRQINLLASSPLFDVEWYLEQYPDVAALRANPLLHYIRSGAAEGRNPGPHFDGNSYLQRYPPVAAAGLNPLLHYIEWGAAEGRQTRPVVKTSDGKPLLTTVEGIAEGRYPALKPLPAFLVPKAPRRLTIITDSINPGSLFGGIGTALILSALLAKRMNATLRLLTRDQPPELENIEKVLGTNGISWEGNIESEYISKERKREVTVSDSDVFLTTSWWGTRSVQGSVGGKRIIYLLQEDERMFYPFGDERLRCHETLASSGIQIVVNSKLLFEHLTTGPDALPNVKEHGVYFEPAFPASHYFPELRNYGPRTSKKKFFFYARPDNLRNLYWRGLQAIVASLEEGVLSHNSWDFHFVGRLIGDVVLPGNVRPQISENMSWSEYAALVRQMDLGLCLMDTPHPSYPPLDLAASGAVVVTNKHGVKQSLSQYSANILCADSTVDGLKNELRKGAGRAGDYQTRLANYSQNHINRNWSTALEVIVESLAEKFSDRS